MAEHECAYVFAGSTTYHRLPGCQSFSRYSWEQFQRALANGKILLLADAPADGHPCANCHSPAAYERWPG